MVLFFSRFLSLLVVVDSTGLLLFDRKAGEAWEDLYES